MTILKNVVKIVFLVGILFCFIKIVNPLNMGGQEVDLPLFDDGYPDTTNIIEYTDDWNAQRDYGLHRAIDIRAEQGTSIYPVADGTVAFIREVPAGTRTGGGNTVIIDHGGGNLSEYCHLDAIDVSEGDPVTRGETEETSTQIGTVGETGHTTGPHIHLQFREVSDPQNPPSNLEEATNAAEGVTTPQSYGNTDETSMREEGLQHHEGEDGGTGGPEDEDDSMEEEEEDGEEDGDPGPGGDRPDDNKSFATSNPSSLISDSKSRFYRLAPKKGKAYILHLWNLEKLSEERGQYFESLSSGGTPDETYLNNLNTKINENYNLLSVNNLQYRKERSETPDVVILRHGYFGSTSSLINKSSEAWRRIIPSFSPLWVKENPLMVIPTGGLYGMENSEQFKSTIADYVSQGGTLVVFAQQHGYEFTVLPTPDEMPIGAYGWREDQSCQSNSIYVDGWHPVLSSTTKSAISSPIDGYFADYPPDSTVLWKW